MINKIIAKIQSGEWTFYTLNDVCRALNARPRDRKIIKKLLDDAERDGDVMRDEKGGYCTPAQAGAFCGTLLANERGFAFIVPDEQIDGVKDFFVPHRSVSGALHKDKVLAVHVKGTDDEARVIKILERGMPLVVGTFAKDKRAGYVLPDEKRFDSDVYIPLSLCQNAKVGDKVVAQITSYPHGRMVGGKIVEVLGESGDFYVEELSIIRSHDIREEFSSAVEKQAQEVSAQPIFVGGRRDLCDLFTFTIDGVDTRDIDDAVSIQIKDGNYVLGVHIADVSHYVQFGSKIDKEAYLRGTSVYFPDRVYPMLPKSLSNGACSLNEGEERYAMTCFMTFDKSGEKLGYEVVESVIKSDRRLTYDEVDSIFDGDGATTEKYADCVPSLMLMKELCVALEKRRKDNGSVELDVKEAHIYVDEDGKIAIPTVARTLSHKLIEQFMISANESVASFAEKCKAPFLYRVHERPSSEKASTFFAFLRQLGINASGDVSALKPLDMQKILQKVENTPLNSVVNKVMLRSMQKAKYSPENLGHFGLASTCYSHFTSPIRRYPDLFNHRVLKFLIHGDVAGATRAYGGVAFSSALDCSERERKAELAERDVDDLYKVAYMSEHIGEQFDGIVSGATNFGVFVELDNGVEGIVPLELLPKDEYEYAEEKMALVGKKHAYRLGEQVKILVAGCDYSNLRTQFAFIDNANARQKDDKKLKFEKNK